MKITLENMVVSGVIASILIMLCMGALCAILLILFVLSSLLVILTSTLLDVKKMSLIINIKTQDF
ncbi:MAG: hypothetical protein J6S23_05095 [Clostridia bacterium]|nr:hypothetical protein [Clostridia bacterium]